MFSDKKGLGGGREVVGLDKNPSSGPTNGKRKNKGDSERSHQLLRGKYLYYYITFLLLYLFIH